MPKKLSFETISVIQHWKGNWHNYAEKGILPRMGAAHCAYCRKYNRIKPYCMSSEGRCPIYHKTGAMFCDRTPYKRLDSVISNDNTENKEELKAAIWAELQFLLDIAYKELME